MTMSNTVTAIVCVCLERKRMTTRMFMLKLKKYLVKCKSPLKDTSIVAIASVRNCPKKVLAIVKTRHEKN